VINSVEETSRQLAV